MQSYGSHMDYDDPGSYWEGGFKDNIDDYKSHVGTIINDWSNSIQTRSLYLEREKILRGAYGQRSDYETEMLNPQNYRPGYGWVTHQVGNGYGPDTYGAYGRVCYVNPDEANSSPNSRYIVSGLYENWEQSERITEYGPTPPNNSRMWPQDYYYSDVKTNAWRWFVLPRMRINTSDANTQKRVVRIEIYKFNSQLLDSFTIFANNFKQAGSYNGEYRDLFYDGPNLMNISSNAEALNTGHSNMDALGMTSNISDCAVDYSVYWWGDADVWLDKVTLEDEWAFYLFHPDMEPTPRQYDFYNKIKEEVQSNFIGSNLNFAYFYADEYTYNRIPCIAEVNRQIKQWRNDCGLVVENNISLIANYSGLRNGIPYDAVYNYLVSAGAVSDILFMYQYPFGQFKTYEDPLNSANDRYTYTPLPPELPLPGADTYPATGDFGQSGGYHHAGGNTGNKEMYDDSLNLLIQNDFKNGFGWQISVIDQLRRSANLVKNNSTIAFTYGIQQHTYEQPLEYGVYGSLREPTNEEIRMQYYLGMAYGAKQLLSFQYFSYYDITTGGNFYGWGMVDENSHQNKRTSNYYQQDKWDSVKTLDINAQHLGNYLLDCNWQSGYSVHLDGAYHNFVSGIVSIDPYRYGQNPCIYENIGNNAWVDCPEKTYWEMSFFTPKSGNTDEKYVMLVNRRCTPCSFSGGGDIRYLRIHFNSASFASHSTWKIFDVLNPRKYKEFVWNYGNSLDLGTNSDDPGYFLPGQGKLFKIVPVINNGGTLLADENISGETFTCLDTVWNNGFNITLGAGTHMSFTDTSKIIMNGGTFTAGDVSYQGPNNVSCSNAGSGSWHGLEFHNCNVHLYNTTFSGVANDTSFAVNIVDCPLVDIRNCTFDCGSDNVKGGINAVYYSARGVSNIYIGGNGFLSANSTVPAINFMSYAGATLPVIIENNSFASQSTSGSTAILLAGVTGGAVKSNIISGFDKSISLLSSSIDIYGNTITSDVSGSKGVFGASGSEIKMNASGSMLLGGQNNISNTGSTCNNIFVDNSYFYLDQGQNVLDIPEPSLCYHLNGFFPQASLMPPTYYATVNCFKVASSPVTPPIESVTNGDGGSQLTFVFDPYLTGCEPGGGSGLDAISLGNGIYDTVTTNGSGNGGGLSSETTALSPPYQRGKSFKEGQGVVIITTKQLYDSISTSMRRHNWTAAKNLCYTLLDNYADSMQSTGAIAKLYLSLIASDTTSASMTNLKTYFETLILNHGTNTAFVNRANYFVQKCKVSLHQYSSALSGFQQIINQNPYSYEGLLARWDYMATTLLMNGGAGGISDVGIEISDLTDENEQDFSPYRGETERGVEIDSDNPFTKEQRQTIRKTVNDALVDSRITVEKKIEILKHKSDNGDQHSKEQLRIIRTLKEVVKTERPKDIFEHIKIVNKDVQKIFGSSEGSKKNKVNNVPTVFRLYQNYPNPFNPIAVIKYDLPNDVKVNIKVYDLLGREVKQLVNEVQKAGSYSVQFDGTNLASGVYFYRIEAGKFIDTKKMVLVK